MPTQKGHELLRKYEGISDLITLGQREAAIVHSPEWWHPSSSGIRHKYRWWVSVYPVSCFSSTPARR